MKGQNEGLISIIIPTFNRAFLINETLDSITRQTYDNWECIIVDDGSTDNTQEVVVAYTDKDPRFKYFKRPSTKKKGANSCRNYGLDISEGTYINWFDSDDIMQPQKLETDLNYIKSGNYDFTISQTKFFSDVGKPIKQYWNECLWSKDPINEFIVKNIGWSTNSPLWKKESLIKSDLFFEEKLQSGQDYLFHIQALSKKMKPVVIDKVLVHQRDHQNKVEFTVYKAKSKTVIFNYLLKNTNTFNINISTKNYLVKKSLKTVSNLYKTKSLKNAIGFSFQLVIKPIGLPHKLKIIKLFFYGLFYACFSIGYQFLTPE